MNNPILNIGNKYFCAFCGNEISTDSYGQTLCQCQDAKEYRKALSIKLQLEIEASKVMANAPKPKFKLTTTITPVLKDSGAYQDNPQEEEPNMCW